MNLMEMSFGTSVWNTVDSISTTCILSLSLGKVARQTSKIYIKKTYRKNVKYRISNQYDITEYRQRIILESRFVEKKNKYIDTHHFHWIHSKKWIFQKIFKYSTIKCKMNRHRHMRTCIFLQFYLDIFFWTANIPFVDSFRIWSCLIVRNWMLELLFVFFFRFLFSFF